ncbi:hypothetical protein [Paraburkholderia acidisoli]|uniref:Uncharacterized protein n=1 Tax=Paraburkholderia acidisoli TaxID=2571748 RepID=A0A7Z2JI47_9BURK|nr:hypothetical protein [Paraburkholderia acidisoli]QGZ66547.1 hypothetical protein FAZ98_32795 [Paraburkholderia acidisoli]
MFAAVTTLALLIVGYVHTSLSRFTEPGRKRVIAHVTLIAVGLMFGVIGAMLAGQVAPPWVVIACGMGIVHIPALCVLILKRFGRSGQS